VKRALLIILLVLSLGVGVPAAQSRGAGQVAAAAHATTPSLRRETFDVVWSTIKDKYWDRTFGGVDWDKVRERYESQAIDAKSDNEFYAVLQQMIGELHQSHFHIFPPEAFDTEETADLVGGSIGIDIQVIDGQAVISRVEPRSTAEAAGLRTGFVITSIDATQVQQVLDRFKKSTESGGITRVRMTRSLLARINGAPRTAVKLGVLDGNDKPREVTVERQRLKGEMSARFGNFPPQYTEFEAKRLEGGIGYIRFNIFVMLLMNRIKDAIRSMMDAPGIIMDLRGNPGGLGGMASGIAGVLETKETSLGVMRMREGYNNFAVFPQPNPYQGPVVILTDGGSASTSEIFAAGMQELGRATIVGEKTIGAALPSVFSKLPTGAIFQYAIADFKTPKGVLVEGRGVTPDVEVKLTRKSLLEGRDIQLEAAITQIKRESKSVTGTR